MTPGETGHDLVVEVTGTAQREAWLAREDPPVEQVRPGLWSIPVPLPLVNLRYVLVYAFELPDGIGLVDAGWDSADAWDALVAGRGARGAAVADVRGVLVTHVHPDHHGLAARLRDTSGAWVGMHPAEAETLPARLGELEAILDGARNELRRLGAAPGGSGRTGVSSPSTPGTCAPSPPPGPPPATCASTTRSGGCCSAATTCCRGSRRTSPRTRRARRTRWATSSGRSTASAAWTSRRCCRRTSSGSPGSRPGWTSWSG